MVGHKAIAAQGILTDALAKDEAHARDARLGAALRGLLGRLLDGPAIIPGDIDTSMLTAAHDCRLETWLLLRGGPRQS